MPRKVGVKLILKNFPDLFCFLTKGEKMFKEQPGINKRNGSFPCGFALILQPASRILLFFRPLSVPEFKISATEEFTHT